jgi:4-amino-4-deoxy-L-arabinose transferase-like glycosyltransferase
MFGASFGTEISWLLPAALIGLVAGLWFTRRAPRTDRTRAALILWGGWLLVTTLVFSFMSGTVHPYYAVALAPAIVALVVIAGRRLSRAVFHQTGTGPAHWCAALEAVVPRERRRNKVHNRVHRRITETPSVAT